MITRTVLNIQTNQNEFIIDLEILIQYLIAERSKWFKFGVGRYCWRDILHTGRRNNKVAALLVAAPKV